MAQTFDSLVRQAQKLVEGQLADNDYNPISVITAETCDLTMALSAAELLTLANERPEVLNHQPNEQYFTTRHPSGIEVLRACICIEIEGAIDMEPFSKLVRQWYGNIFQPPRHLLVKMQTVLKAA